MEPQGQLALDGPVPADVARGAVEEASIVTQLVAPIRAAVQAAGMLSLLDEVESPLIAVLARMEVAGIQVDTDELAGSRRSWWPTWPPSRPRSTSWPGIRSTSTRRRSCAPSSTTRSASSPVGARRPATRPTRPRSKGCATSTRSWKPCCGTGSSRSCVPPTARTCSPSAGRRAHPRVVPPDVARTGRLSSEHPTCTTSRPQRLGAAVPPRVHPRSGFRVPGGRLRPDRAAGPGPPGRRPRPPRGVLVRNRHPPGRRLGRLRRARRRGHAHPTGVFEDGLLRPRLRHGGLRPGPSARDGSRRRPRSWAATSAPSRPCGRTWTTR